MNVFSTDVIKHVKDASAYHWVTDGQPHCRKELPLGNKEAMAIMTYFYETMPEDTEARSVERTLHVLCCLYAKCCRRTLPTEPQQYPINQKKEEGRLDSINQ